MANRILMYVTAFFMALAALDRALLGKRLGLGQKFEEGIYAVGPLAIAMVGLMCFAPVLGKILTPFATPLYRLIGSDPAMMAGSVLSLNMGGYPLAQIMTADVEVAALSGLFLGSMLGCIFVFAVPVALNLVPARDRPYLAQGVMLGVIAAPVGTFAAALLAGMPLSTILPNLVSVVALSALLALGLWKAPDIMMRGFDVFARLVTLLLTATFACAGIEAMTGYAVIPGMEPIGPQLEVVGIIGVTLAGAYPMLHCLTKALAGPLGRLGALLGVNETTVTGLVAALANSVPTYAMVGDMDARGKVMAIAFTTPAAAAFGAHLGYVSANAPEYAFPLVAGKLTGGLFALGLAWVYLRKKKDI